MLKYKDLYDYTISVLYTLKRKNQTGFFSLREIIESLDYPSTPNEIFEIGKYLEAEGYVKANYNIGDVFVEITPHGIVYIENKEESFLPSFEEYINQKKQNANVEKVASKLSSNSIAESKKPIISKINEIISYLNSVRVLKNSDLHKDTKILKLEVEKENPDKEIITLKIIHIEEFPGLKRQASELKEYLSPFIGRYQ